MTFGCNSSGTMRVLVSWVFTVQFPPSLVPRTMETNDYLVDVPLTLALGLFDFVRQHQGSFSGKNDLVKSGSATVSGTGCPISSNGRALDS